jgi:hypothetical protein
MSNFIRDEMLTHELIATCRTQIDQEYEATVERVNRLRGSCREHQCDEQEREEWAHFNDRVRPLRKQIEALVKTIADLRMLRAPPPQIISSR